MNDQYIKITELGGVHYATGTPSIIYGLLVTGREVVCSRVDGGKRREYVLRLAPHAPFSLTYDEAEVETVNE